MHDEIKAMERLWADAYPTDVDRKLSNSAHRSIQEMWVQACMQFADRVAYSMDSSVISYADLNRRSICFASWLSKLESFAPAERVAIMLPNVLHYPVALLGALRAGAIVVNANPQYTQRELTHQLKDSGAKVIVIAEGSQSLLASCLSATNIRHVVVVPAEFSFDRKVWNLSSPQVVPASNGVAIGWTDFNSLFEMPFAQSRWQDVESSPDEIAFLQYTGGTTGLSKGAMLTHGNILANIEQAHTWFYPSIKSGENTVLTVLPLYHIFALTANCLLFARCGARNILVPNPKDLPTLLGYFKRAEVTILTGVNTLFNGLLHAPGFGAFDFSTLKLVIAGGAAVQKAVAQKWASVTGTPIVEGYGLTEASPFVACNLLGSEFNGTIGIPIPSTFIEVRDDTGEAQPVGHEGEICIRGPQVMKGYWMQPEETAVVLDEKGWLRSGDIGFIDSRGAVTITDRKKDIILVSGFNVYPNEIESVLASHPEVFESAAVGIPDAQTGEAIRVYVVRRSEHVSENDLLAYCRSQLTAYKTPRSINFVEQLPKSNVGKILRRELRAQAELTLVR